MPTHMVPSSIGYNRLQPKMQAKLITHCTRTPYWTARIERIHLDGKADRSTESDRTGRGAAHHAGPRGTPERHAAGHNQGRRTGAKQQWPPGAANPESAHNTQRTTARGQVPSNTSRRPDRRLRARQRTMPLPATEQPPSGWTRFEV